MCAAFAEHFVSAFRLATLGRCYTEAKELTDLQAKHRLLTQKQQKPWKLNHKILPHLWALLKEKGFWRNVQLGSKETHILDAVSSCRITLLNCKEIVLIPCLIQNSSIWEFKDSWIKILPNIQYDLPKHNRAFTRMLVFLCFFKSEQTPYLRRWFQKGSAGSTRGPTKQTAVMTN